jgi:glycosyltransferase involved in cell wall biosynthesis
MPPSELGAAGIALQFVLHHLGGEGMIDFQNPDYSNTPASSRRPVYGYLRENPADPPAVSIVTPFFNTGPVFIETVESVLRQSLQQWEWIIVDDGSDDPKSLEILECLVARDPRVSIKKGKARSGPAAARNLGVAAARAGFVALLDSDDLLEPTALEKWLWFLTCHPQYAMVKGYQAGFGAHEYIWREGFHSGKAILKENLIQTGSMVRRDIYLAVGGMDEKIRGGMEDWDFWLRCANAGHWGSTIPEVLDWYRRRPSHNDRWDDWDSSKRQEAFRDELHRRYPRLLEYGFPEPKVSHPMPFAELPEQPGFANRLRRQPGYRYLLVLVPHFVLGGSDKFTLDLVAQLTEKHAFKVTLVSTLPSTHDWRHRFEALTPDVFTPDTFLTLRDYPRFLTYLIRSRGIDCVLVTHSQMGYQFLPFLRSHFPDVPCYDYLHIEEPTWKEGGYPAYSITYSPFLDRTITSSEHLKRWITERGIDHDKVKVVYTNIDTADWSVGKLDTAKLRQKWKLPDGVPVVLFAGRLCEQKQPDVLAAVARKLQEQKIAYLCLVAGEGEGGPWLRNYIEQHGLTSMRLLGRCSSEEVRELLAISDIFFLPSRHEGISLALFEAMALSVPVVAADVGGQRELVTPECGFLVDADEEQVSKYLEVLSFLLTNATARKKMGASALQRVKDHFPLDKMGCEMAELMRGKSNAAPFDVGSAFRQFAAGYAREMVEHRRTEWVADQLWMQVHQPAVETVNQSALAAPSQMRFDRTKQALAMLWPLVGGTAHGPNRKLLFAVLLDAKSRRELGRFFDRVFYCRANPDVPAFGPLPLLHYVFYGYREGRPPSAELKLTAAAMANQEAVGAPGNPLLRDILKTRRHPSVLAD